MSYSFKKLSDVEMAQIVNETTNVLIEENGEIKRVSENKVGGVQVSGVEPGQAIVVKTVDENGKPTSWESANLVREWEDLENKPFGDERTYLFKGEATGYEPDGYFDFPELINIVPGKEYLIEYKEEELFAKGNSSEGEIFISFTLKDGTLIYIYPYGLHVGIGKSLYLSISEVQTRQLDRKFIPGLPYLVKVRFISRIDEDIEGSWNWQCECDLSESEIEELMRQGTFLYAAFYNYSGDKWHLNADVGFLYCSKYNYPDDDQVIFSSLDGRGQLVFSSRGTVTYYHNNSYN